MPNTLEKRPFLPKIEGVRIHLELCGPRHSATVWSYIERDHLKGGKIYRWIESESDVKKYITELPDLNVRDITYLIFKMNQAIGSIHIHTLNYLDHKAEIGFAIEKGEEGMGYVSESVGLIETEMKRLGFNKLVISCSPDNLRSMQVAERNGFKKEGVFVQDVVEDGGFRDSVIFGKLLREGNENTCAQG